MALVICATVFAALAVTFTVACSGTATKDTAPPAQTAAPVDPATTGTVSGTVPGAAPSAIATLTPSGNEVVPPPPTTPVMDQIQLSFVPGTLIAYANAPVSFRSSDSELHNINVRNPDKRASEFNRSIPPGGTFDYVFKEPGFYDVRCDIHPAMTAEIFVSATPYAEVVGSDGRFVFEHIPPGAYTLTIYNGASTSEQPVEVKVGSNEIAVAPPHS